MEYARRLECVWTSAELDVRQDLAGRPHALRRAALHEALEVLRAMLAGGRSTRVRACRGCVRSITDDDIAGRARVEPDTTGRDEARPNVERGPGRRHEQVRPRFGIFRSTRYASAASATQALDA